MEVNERELYERVNGRLIDRLRTERKQADFMIMRVYRLALKQRVGIYLRVQMNQGYKK